MLLRRGGVRLRSALVSKHLTGSRQMPQAIPIGRIFELALSVNPRLTARHRKSRRSRRDGDARCTAATDIPTRNGPRSHRRRLLRDVAPSHFGRIRHNCDRHPGSDRRVDGSSGSAPSDGPASVQRHCARRRQGGSLRRCSCPSCSSWPAASASPPPRCARADLIAAISAAQAVRLGARRRAAALRARNRAAADGAPSCERAVSEPRISRPAGRHHGSRLPSGNGADDGNAPAAAMRLPARTSRARPSARPGGAAAGRSPRAPRAEHSREPREQNASAASRPASRTLSASPAVTTTAAHATSSALSPTAEQNNQFDRNREQPPRRRRRRARRSARSPLPRPPGPQPRPGRLDRPAARRQ